MADQSANQHAKATLTDLQRQIGFEATRKCEAFCNSIIAKTLRTGTVGQLLLKYLAIKILAIMDAWD